jgi:hypothetical protein
LLSLLLLLRFLCLRLSLPEDRLRCSRSNGQAQ